MAVIKTIEKGESLTFGFVLPETYNLANLQAVKIYIGSSIYKHKMDGRTVRVELESNQTALITGRNIVHFVIDDAVFGIKKINCGELEVLPTQATHKDESVNTGYDVEIVLSINVETVSVGSVLYDTLKGDKGDAGTIEVGAVTTGDAGTDVIVENVGTPSEAVLNFTIPRGSSGDFFSGDYNLIINKQDAKWVDGWLHIDTGAKTRDKIIQVGYLSINTGIGTEQLKPIVHYPAGLTYQFSSIPNGFYLKDVDGRLSENTDFEFLDVRYNILSDTTYKYDGLTQLPKAGFILDEVNGKEYHSKYGIYAFNAVCPEYTGVQVQSVLDALTNFSGVDSFYTPTYARLKGCNLISRPYQNAAINENLGSNPDILTIAAHYGNTFERRDITANENTFIQNVIAIGSCGDGEPDPLTWTSYGYGMEFAERGNNLGLNADYPDQTFKHVIGWGTVSGTTYTDTTPSRNLNNVLTLQVGSKIHVGLNENALQERTIASISGHVIEVTEAFDPLAPGTNYLYMDAQIGTAWQAAADNQKYYQSPVCSIIAAKFRKIQDLSGANWHICRMAARATASNGGTWDMYRGFGVIDVDAAVQYIEDNYKSLAYRAMLADQYNSVHGVSPFITYDDLLDDSPVPKRDIVAELAKKVDKVAGKSLVDDTEIAKLATIDFEQEKTTPIDADSAGIWDSVLGKFVLTTWANVKATLKTYFDTLYEKLSNKQNSLIADGTGTKFPTVDALNANFRNYTPTIPYANRVLSDSGVISDIEKLTKLYVENLKLLPNTVYMWDGSAGMKTRTSGVNQYATKLYDMSAGNRDAVQATEANQPFVGGGVAPNEQRKLNGLTGETGTKGLTGTDIQIASSGAFTLAIAVKWNYPRTSSRIYLSATNHIELTASAITLRGDSGNVLTCAHVFRTCLTEILIFEYNNGAGLIRVNGVEKTTTATSGAVTFGSLFLNQTSYNFDGEIGKLQIANIRLSASQIQNLYNFTRLQHPEIEGINIGNQHWATSNYEGVVTGNGTVIPDLQGASTAANSEIWSGGDFESGLFGSILNEIGGAVVSYVHNEINPISGTRDGLISITNAGSNKARPILSTPNSYLSVKGKEYIIEFDYKVVSGEVEVFRVGLGGHTLLAVSETLVGTGHFSKSFVANDSAVSYGGINFNGTKVGSVQIDNISFKEVGWADLTTPAWCYYGNDPLNGAVYGKEYNLYGAQAINLNAPTGYTIGTYAQWLQMVTLLGGTSIAGNKMKLSGTALWAIGNAGTNESGFTALPTGQRNADGTFSQINNKANFWTSDGYLVTLDYNAATVTFTSGADAKIGAAVRLLRNEPVGATERTIETGYITNALGATNLDISIPFGYQVESVRIDSETNITGLSAKLYTGALEELETLFTAKSVTANVQKVIAADADQSIQQTDAVVRINGTKANTASRFRVWVKITKVVFS